jgi:hypothetical protein
LLEIFIWIIAGIYITKIIDGIIMVIGFWIRIVPGFRTSIHYLSIISDYLSIRNNFYHNLIDYLVSINLGLYFFLIEYLIPKIDIIKIVYKEGRLFLR